MANEIDSAIAETLVSLPTAKMLDYLWEQQHAIRDDSNYWQLVAAAWIAAGDSQHLDQWITLFSAKRRNRNKVMKKGDRLFWRGLPDPVKVFRAAMPGENLQRAISWSLDDAVCRRMWPGRPIEVRYFLKSDIIAYFNRRGEHEIIRLPAQPEKVS